MEDTEFYGQLLVLPDLWRVRKLALDIATNRVDIWVDEAAGTMWDCSECSKGALHIMTYFKHRIFNAKAEGLKSKIQMLKKMAFGFRNREHYRMAINFHFGGLNLYP